MKFRIAVLFFVAIASNAVIAAWDTIGCYCKYRRAYDSPHRAVISGCGNANDPAGNQNWCNQHCAKAQPNAPYAIFWVDKRGGCEKWGSAPALSSNGPS